MNNNVILSINNISKDYYNKNGIVNAIKDISFSLYEGEFLVIVGPSGCGKTTLLNIIGNLENKSSGVIISNNDIKIGYMFQENSLFPWLNVLDNCLFGLKMKNMLTEENISYVKELLNNYGLNNFMFKYPNELSGGMKQRVL